MKDSLKLVLVVGFLILLIGGAYLGYELLQGYVETDRLSVADVNVADEGVDMSKDTEVENPPKQSETAPDFAVYDADGEGVRLSDYFGKPIVLNFWASWCGPCKMEMPDFQEMYEKIGEDINFLMVNMTDGQRETLEIATEFIEECGYTFPVAYDTDMDAAIKYDVCSLPTTYFIDKNGQIVAQAPGAIDKATLQKGIDMIKGE